MAPEEMLLRDLLVTTKDGEWGQGEPGDNVVSMSVIRGTDFEAVRLGDLSNLPVRFIPEHVAARKALRPRDIVIETAGGTKGRPTGRTVYLRDELLSSSPRPVTCASFSRFLRVNPEFAEPEYVYWYLQYLYAVGEMEHHQVQHTGVARFQYTAFAASTTIRLPSRERQRSVCDALRHLDERIALNRTMNGTLESIARAIFKSWFVDFEPVRKKMEGGEVGLPPDLAALFPDSLVPSDARELPAGWTQGCLGEVAVQARDSVRPEDIRPGTPYFGLEHLPKRSIALADWHFADEVASSKSQFVVGDILFGKLRPYFHKVGPPPVEGVCSTDIVVVRPRSRELFAFTLGHLSGDDFVDRASARSSGTRMPRTNWRDMAEYPLAIPPRSLLWAYDDLVRPLVELIWSGAGQSRLLAGTRDALIPSLIAGSRGLPLEHNR